MLVNLNVEEITNKSSSNFLVNMVDSNLDNQLNNLNIEKFDLNEEQNNDFNGMLNGISMENVHINTNTNETNELIINSLIDSAIQNNNLIVTQASETVQNNSLFINELVDSNDSSNVNINDIINETIVDIINNFDLVVDIDISSN